VQQGLRFRLVAAVLVTGNIFLVAIRGDQSLAHFLLVAGLHYVVVALIADCWERRRHVVTALRLTPREPGQHLVNVDVDVDVDALFVQSSGG